MTATLEVVVPIALNQCIAPFVPAETLIVDVEQVTPQVIGSEFDENKAFTFTTIYTNVDSQWSINRFTSAIDQTVRIELNYSFEFQPIEPGETFPNEPELLYFTQSQPQSYVPATTTTGWPDTPQVGVTYNVKQVWENFEQTTGDLEFVYMNDEAGDQTEMTVAAGATLKISKYA